MYKIVFLIRRQGIHLCKSYFKLFSVKGLLTANSLVSLVYFNHINKRFIHFVFMRSILLFFITHYIVDTLYN